MFFSQSLIDVLIVLQSELDWFRNYDTTLLAHSIQHPFRICHSRNRFTVTSVEAETSEFVKKLEDYK